VLAPLTNLRTRNPDLTERFRCGGKNQRALPAWPEPMSDKAPARHGPDAQEATFHYRAIGGAVRTIDRPCDRHHRGSVSPHPTLREHERSIQEHAIRGIGSTSRTGLSAAPRT